MSRRCAVCWKPSKGSTFKGHVESNWLCSVCRAGAYNQDWVMTPKHEVYGAEDSLESNPARIEYPSKSGPFEGDKAIAIMRLYVQHKSNHAIAREVGVRRSYVQKTISYWLNNHGYLVEQLRLYFSRLC